MDLPHEAFLLYMYEIYRCSTFEPATQCKTKAMIEKTNNLLKTKMKNENTYKVSGCSSVA